MSRMHGCKGRRGQGEGARGDPAIETVHRWPRGAPPAPIDNHRNAIRNCQLASHVAIATGFGFGFGFGFGIALDFSCAPLSFSPQHHSLRRVPVWTLHVSKSFSLFKHVTLSTCSNDTLLSQFHSSPPYVLQHTRDKYIIIYVYKQINK